MIRAIILCCDEKNKKLGMKEYSGPPPARDLRHYDVGGGGGGSGGGGDGGGGGGVDMSDPSLERSYGDGLNCGYMQERFSYSSGQSPSYTNYRMGWSTGYLDCQANARHHQGIISTPLPNKYRMRSNSAQLNGGMLVSREARRDFCEEDFPSLEENISDSSLSKWPPSGEQKDSLRKGFYTSFNRDIFQEKTELECPDLWSSLEYPPSPKDAFRETCEFYGEPSGSRKYPEMRRRQGRSEKFYREKPRRLDFYQSDSKLSHLQHYVDSSCDETEVLSRSKSLHDLQPDLFIQDQPGQPSPQVGLSEQDLNRARSVLGLPISGPDTADNDLGYDSQPGSARNSINLSEVTAGAGGGGRGQSQRYRSQSYTRRDNSQVGRSIQCCYHSPHYHHDHSQLQRSTTPSTARVSFPSPCITGTRQLTDQSSTSHPPSPPSPSPSGAAAGKDQSLTLLKQYYLDCILKIDPNHPVGKTFQKVRFPIHANKP